MDASKGGQAVSHIVDAHVAYIKAIADLSRDKVELLERIKRLEEALDLVIPNCSWVHHSKKHQHKCGEPCPVVALIEKSKEAKL
jgi:hypothetical protein